MAKELKGMEGHKDMFETNNKNKPKQVKRPMSVILAPQLKAFGLEPKTVAIETQKTFTRTPALLSASAESVMLSVALAMFSGLSTDPQDGEFAIIPYKDKKTLKTVAQSQVMWKGYKKVIETYGEGIKELRVVEIKDIEKEILDVKHIETMMEDSYSTNGEFTVDAKIFGGTVMEKIQRRKQKTVAYLALIVLDKDVYKSKNFGCLMTVEDIQNWKNTHNIQTIISDSYFARKTVAKKVAKDFKELLIMKDRDVLKETIRRDQSSQDKEGNIIYVETQGGN